MTDIQLVIATHNKSKYQEMLTYLSPLFVNIEPLSSYSTQEPEENGLSFVENALIKARAACQITHSTCLADDSGLCVPSLGHRPGIYSRRFSGETATDHNNCQKLLQLMSAQKNRHAFFYCVLVLMRSPEDPCPIIAQGNWTGDIAEEAQNPEKGFGYEPVFIPKGSSYTANQITLDEKNKVSHRGQAMKKLIEQLRNHDQYPDTLAHG